MRITKKLAKEIFEGNFENVPLEEWKNKRVTTNYFNTMSDLNKAYTKPEYLESKDFEGLTYLKIVQYLESKDFEGLTYLKIVHTYGGKYNSKKTRKYELMTDVLHIWKHEGKWYATIARENSSYYSKGVEIQVTEEVKMKAIVQILNSQKEILK